MTREEAIKMLKYNSNVIHRTINGETDLREVEALEMAIKALEQEPCKDCVDRHSVDLLACRYLKEPTDNHVRFYEDFLDLPSVTPIRPKGHWIERELVGDVFKFKDSRKILICSNCKMGIAKEILGMSNFCPNCGIKMESEG